MLKPYLEKNAALYRAYEMGVECSTSPNFRSIVRTAGRSAGEDREVGDGGKRKRQHVDEDVTDTLEKIRIEADEKSE